MYLNKTIKELTEILKDADSSTASEINEILGAIKGKKPDKILKKLEKANRLKDHVDYYLKIKPMQLKEIESDLKSNQYTKTIIEILISSHILADSNKKSKIVWPPWALSKKKI